MLIFSLVSILSVAWSITDVDPTSSHGFISDCLVLGCTSGLMFTGSSIATPVWKHHPYKVMFGRLVEILFIASHNFFDEHMLCYKNLTYLVKISCHSCF